jgi:glycosyltransferase involved in cell wall biosynthesis
VSVLIPARNEEHTIGAAVKAALASRGAELEVLVLDDQSEDATAEVVSEIASQDTRVRLLRGQPLPAGWCGKPFACWTLAGAARHPLLAFLDADVRLAPTPWHAWRLFKKNPGPTWSAASRSRRRPPSRSGSSSP